MGAAFGARYESVIGLAVPYLGAMALLGVARVLIAHGCAQGTGRRAAIAVGVVAVGQAIGLVVAHKTAAALSHVTLAATATLTALALLQSGDVIRLPGTDRSLNRALARFSDHSVRLAHWLAQRVAARPALAVITAAALIVRVIPTRGIWLDEATSITQSQMSLPKLLDSLRTTDVHPPLHHLTLWVLAHTLGTSEIVMRAPSIVAGTVLVPVLYALGRELYDERAGLLAAAMGAFAPFLVWYSQEARMYAYFMLFASLAMLGQLRALRRGERRDWALYGASTALLIWSQYFSILFTLTQQAIFMVAAWRAHRAGRPVKPLARPWLITTGFIVLALLPLAPFAFDQFAANQASGRGFNAPQQAGHVASTHALPNVYSALTNIVWAVVGYHSNGVMAALTALWPLVMLGALMLLGRRSQPRSRWLLACALVPAAIMMLVGFAKPFLFEVRYFAATAPLLLVLLARAATGWVRTGAATAAVGAVLAAGMGVATADQQLNGSNPRVYDFGGAVAQVDRDAHPGDVLLYDPPYLSDVIKYYKPDVRAQALAKGAPKGTRRVYLVTSLEGAKTRRQIIRQSRQTLGHDYRLVAVMHRPQIHIWVLQKGAKR
jgi:hypothetical protein